MSLPQCAICGVNYLTLDEDEGGVCADCLRKHNQAKQKKEDEDMLLRFAVEYEPKGIAHVQDAYEWAAQMLAEYKKRVGQ